MINSDDNPYLNDNLSSLLFLCASENCTSEISSSSVTENTLSNWFLAMLVLSILSIFGCCFMIFGPLQRTRAYKHIENFIFGQHPIFNVGYRQQSTDTYYDGIHETLKPYLGLLFRFSFSLFSGMTLTVPVKLNKTKKRWETIVLHYYLSFEILFIWLIDYYLKNA